MPYLSAGLGIAVLIIGALLWNSERQLSNANQKIGRLETTISTAVDANESTVASLNACRSINLQNKIQRDNAVQRAAEAASRAATLANQLEAMNETPTTTDTSCRQIDDPLPADFISQLCIGTANCS